jgi:DNA-binding LytR/AlgR family response regulator
MDVKLKCIVIDDEPIALALLEKYVLQTPFLDLQGKFSNAISASEFLKEKDVDVIFTDIQMPDLDGLELSKMIPKTTKVVFTTAFDEYAIEGFRVDAMDYLLKPFDYAEFLKAAQKVQEWFDLVQSKNQAPAENSSEKKFLFVKSEYKQIKIDLDEIDLIEGLKDYAKIWLTGNPKALLTLMSLKKLEEELPSQKFMRIHRSYIISLDKIESIERNQVVIREKHIPISDQYKEVFQEYVQKNSLR